MLDHLLASLLITLFTATLSFILSIKLKRNDIADITWGIYFILIAITNLSISGLGTKNPPLLIIFLLTAIWAGRLSIHIFKRNKNKPEDFRYKKWREEWGSSFFIRSFLQVYLLQGLLALVISLSIIVTAATTPLSHSTPQTILLHLGIITWVIGFLFESIGDHQLATFIKTRSDKKQVLNSGLWRYTRHPNYFGEVTQWWGIFIIAISSQTLNNPLPIIIALLSPITITFLILKVSGIPMLEKKYQENAAYQEYAKKTNKFFPWKPKSS